MKKLLVIMVIGFCRITRYKLDTKEINQVFEVNDARKRK